MADAEAAPAMPAVMAVDVAAPGLPHSPTSPFALEPDGSGYLPLLEEPVGAWARTDSLVLLASYRCWVGACHMPCSCWEWSIRACRVVLLSHKCVSPHFMCCLPFYPGPLLQSLTFSASDEAYLFCPLAPPPTAASSCITALEHVNGTVLFQQVSMVLVLQACAVSAAMWSNGTIPACSLPPPCGALAPSFLATTVCARQRLNRSVCPAPLPLALCRTSCPAAAPAWAQRQRVGTA